MELREWLIILGLALVSLIVVDGVRRLQRQRRVPRLDQAVKDLPTAKLEEFDDEAREAEINWELPNGGARVVKAADYSGLGQKPKLERQEHPGPSRVLYDFRRSFTKSSGKPKPAAAKPNKAEPAVQAATVNVSATADASAETRNEMREPPRREPSVFTAREEAPKAEAPQPATPEPSMSAMEDEAPQSQQTGTAPASFSATDEAPSEQPNTAELNASHTPEPHAELESNRAPEEPAAAEPDITPEPEPVLRAEPEDAVFAKHASDAPKRRQLRADMAGDHELDDDEIDEYRLVDFEGIGRSFKRRIIERRKEKAIKKPRKPSELKQPPSKKLSVKRWKPSSAVKRSRPLKRKKRVSLKKSSSSRSRCC